MKNNKIFGIILVILSLSIFINIFAFELPYTWFKITAAATLVLYSLSNIKSNNFIKILVPISLAVVVLDFYEPLANYSFEFILGTLMLAIGLNILIYSKQRSRDYDTTYHTNQSNISNEFNTLFGETNYTVDSFQFEHASITCRFGESTINFSHVKLLNEMATIDITCNFSQLTLLIPAHFNLKSQVNTLAGNINVPANSDESEMRHTLILTGNVIFSELKIVRT